MNESDDSELSVFLYGTTQAPPPSEVLRAGPLSAELDAGNLRHVRIGDVEIMRAVSFIVRDRNWGTYDPVISDLTVEQSDDHFTVSYSASATEGDTRFDYRAHIVGTPSELRFDAEGESSTGFETNRTGFVVLHSIVGVAGAAVQRESVDGSVVDGLFPEAIDPVQPMMSLRALTHEPVTGLRVSCRMEGDTFEMEDQRNWTDASYKTYVRPLSLPWPYRLEAGEKLEQRVVLSVTGSPESSTGASHDIGLTLEAGAGRLPNTGVGATAADALDEPAVQTALQTLGPNYVICHHDPRRGDDAESLQRQVTACAASGSDAWLEAVVVEVEDFAAELRALGALVQDLGSPFTTVLVSPAADLRGTLPGSPWPPAPPLDALYAAARESFPNTRIGGGTFAFFTELNRKRPPTDALDLVGFTTSALVHAGDDVTAMENLEALPFMATTTRSIANDREFVVGPSALGMRLNPYGAAPMENPTNIRQAMNRNDPRQRGLLGAAWAVGYHAAFAGGGAASIAYGSVTGAHGLVHTTQSWPQPWFDEHGGVFPQFHVLRLLAAWSGNPMTSVKSDDVSSITGIGVETDQGRALLIANLGPRKRRIQLPGKPTRVALLDAAHFAAAAADPAFLDKTTEHTTDRLEMDAYAVAHVVIEGAA